MESQNNELCCEKCFQLLDDLIERRNDIAHGVDDADDNILSTDVLLEYADYVVAFSNAIYSIVLSKYVETTIFSQGKNVFCLGKPIQTFNNSIVCFNNNRIKISIGDIIAGMNTCEKFRVGHIESLQINGKSVDCISPKISIDFGAKVGFHASNQYSYYIVK